MVLPALAAAALLAPPVSAQVADSIPDHGEAEWSPPISNLLLGGVFVGTLAAAKLDITEGLDTGIGPHPEGKGTLIRDIPDILGSSGLYFGLAGGAVAIGTLAGSSTAKRVGWRTIETLAVTGLTTIGLKATIGRTRPGFGREPDEFDAFTDENSYWAFPSGHTSTAFAVATVLTLELGESAPWIPYVAYPIATWVGAARVMDEKHWPTDIVAGAALGILGAQIWHGLRRDDSSTRSALGPAIWSHPDAGVVFGLHMTTGGALE